LAVYRQRRLPTLVAALMTLWYASTVQSFGNESIDLTLADVPPDGFIQYLIIMVLLTAVVASIIFVLTWQIGNFTQRRLSNFRSGFYTVYGVVLLLVSMLIAGTLAGIIPKVFSF